MAENLDYEQLKLDYAKNKLKAERNISAENKLSDAQYIAKLEELCDTLISSLDPQDPRAQIIALILDPKNTDLKGEAKKFAMESVIN